MKTKQNIKVNISKGKINYKNYNFNYITSGIAFYFFPLTCLAYTLGHLFI